ncbi:MAG: TIGR00296 family protein [Candidatus Altiarchaeota archaeon]|nr:TIGR00296 family protein [Candidatus Altiarchaeota archaeon]
MILTHAQGTDIVQYARAVVEGHFSRVKPKMPESLKKVFSEKKGTFVTILKNKSLRGCIGYPEPILKLGLAVERAALSAAFEDPRFWKLQEDELGSITFEVSVLTAPKLVKVNDPREYVKKIKIGRDGLIAERGHNRGLLLPQVPIELRWDVDEFLEHTCAKAGLMPNEHLKPGFSLYSFTAQVYSEETPRGDVSEKNLREL